MKTLTQATLEALTAKQEAAWQRKCGFHKAQGFWSKTLEMKYERLARAVRYLNQRARGE